MFLMPCKPGSAHPGIAVAQHRIALPRQPVELHELRISSGYCLYRLHFNLHLMPSPDAAVQLSTLSVGCQVNHKQLTSIVCSSLLLIEQGYRSGSLRVALMKTNLCHAWLA